MGAQVIEEEELCFSPEFPKVRSHNGEGMEPPVQFSPHLRKEKIKALIQKNPGKILQFQDR